ncbi:RagB/SusD family nutrient uptake outer membrane protein [Aquimarina sp. 2201CG14-23]|uniref:RagB/SusD family nutrient uptake outer membrane protein n=1 Tax=Aquimarina mycalae TaxID=3040073 RepID=UPI00247804F9|nr:RagB/SusD family nutrient uptake outer membrane protein [Aquimarina sp. 2201CG14-23]MDH7448077.1 RagB/SusD family nutrient uptake outer membrane protein [Aquimarina sp. 2201CG14-23]
MKHIFKLQNRFINFNIYALCLALLTMSCDLEEDVISFRSDNNFYNNQEELNRGVIAAYSSLYDVMAVEWNVTELRSDNTFTNPDRSPESDAPRFTLDRLTVDTNNSLNQQYYANCYKTIALANRIIANLTVVEDQNLRNQYEGEAKFLRALMHFNLTRLYGSTVISDRVLIGEEGFELSRRPATEVYNFIIQDLEDAIALLPEQYDDSEFGRATGIAARTILGKVHLSSPGRDLEAAITQLEYVRDRGINDLLANYDDLFEPGNELNNEVIFSVRYEQGLIGLGSPFPNFFAPLQSDGNVVFGNGDGLNVPTEDVSDTYLIEDQRKPTSMADSYIATNGTEIFNKHVTKYNSDFNALDDGDVDWPVTRFADVLLMLSEAYVDARSISEALIELNKVRVRAGLTPLTESDVNSSFAFRLALENERRLEFAFENHRFFDLLRTNRALTVINEHFVTEFAYNNPDNPDLDANPISEFQLLLPIPQREIDLNPNLAQNIGY